MSEKWDDGHGPNPYKKSHSVKPASMASHAANSGRGGKGVFGGADGNKGPRSDISHPESHAAFEELGRGDSGE